MLYLNQNYLSFDYVVDCTLYSDKEVEFTEGMALAVRAKWRMGGAVAWRWRRAARGVPPSMRMSLDVVLRACPTMCSTG